MQSFVEFSVSLHASVRNLAIPSPSFAAITTRLVGACCYRGRASAKEKKVACGVRVPTRPGCAFALDPLPQEPARALAGAPMP
eukprot:364233-Chlamydomonas_euryale.AAC.5